MPASVPPGIFRIQMLLTTSTITALVQWLNNGTHLLAPVSMPRYSSQLAFARVILRNKLNRVTYMLKIIQISISLRIQSQSPNKKPTKPPNNVSSHHLVLIPDIAFFSLLVLEQAGSAPDTGHLLWLFPRLEQVSHHLLTWPLLQLFCSNITSVRSYLISLLEIEPLHTSS